MLLHDSAASTGNRIGTYPDAFNWLLSKIRQSIERAFGLLFQRWGIFWRPLRIKLKLWSKLIMSVARLQNFCITNGDQPMRSRASRDTEDGDEMQVLSNNFPADNQPRPEGITRRCKFQQNL